MLVDSRNVSTGEGRTLPPKLDSLAKNRPDAYLAHMRSVLPHLVIGSVRMEPAGQRSDVLVVNNSMVFRFPRTSDGVEALAVEITMLRGVRLSRCWDSASAGRPRSGGRRGRECTRGFRGRGLSAQ
jgi:hypothetical protein